MFEWLLKLHPAAATLSLFGVLFVVVVGLQMWQKTRTPPESVLVSEVKSADPKLEATVLSVASRFICSCGSCGEKPLDTCACERAVEERQFIRNYLQEGQSVAQVIAAVDQSYGWKKTDSTSKSGSPPPGSLKAGNISLPSQAAGPLTTISARAAGNDGVATTADKMEVFSHFRCPCGQCGMDDLNACTCEHPRGAKEIKAFVDQRIDEGKLTVAQLVREVDQKYGGRKN
jgi:cytochrome c-type biogenesis protein CcmH/NrfF